MLEKSGLEVITEIRKRMLEETESIDPKNHIAKKLKGFKYSPKFPLNHFKFSDDVDDDLNKIRSALTKAGFYLVPSQTKNVEKYAHKGYPEKYHISWVPGMPGASKGQTRISIEME
jgi:hypothetical protein